MRRKPILYTLGKLSLGDASFTRLKPLILLSYLSLEGPQSRAHLGELLWSDAKTPLGGLSVALSRLRQVCPGSIEADEYVVKSTLPTDALAFTRAAQQRQYKAALDLYQGSFLENVILPGWSVTLESWVYTTGETLAAQAQTCLLKLAERYAEEGRVDLAAQYAETAYTLPAAPAPEPETLTLIFDLLQEGRHEAAQAVAAEAEELGLTLVKAASSRAKTSAVSHNLPPSKNAFIGRHEEIVMLSTRLSDPNCRLLTLKGPGGIGKSRLALNVARAQLSLPHFKDGVYFASLESLGSPDLVPTRIAEVLELSLSAQESPIDLIMSFLHQKRVLLVLDNFEHLREAVLTLAEILAACPLLTCLVTSRVRLNLKDEWVFRVDGLAYPTSAGQLDVLLDYDAPKLFTQRAQQALINLSLTRSDYPDLIKLCSLTGGMPLALELAAAWLRTISLRQVVEEVERGIGLLASDYRNDDTRHESISGILEQSWQHLSKDGQEALLKLSVFEGGFTRAAATQVAGTTLSTLASLLDASMLSRKTGERYGFHPLTKQYFLQRLLEDLAHFQATKCQHASHYLSLAEEAESELRGEKQKGWLERLDQELSNFRSALHWSISQGEAETALRLASALLTFWEVRGYFAEGLAWLEQSLGLVGKIEERSRVKALHAAGTLAERQGDLKAAHTYFEAGLTSAKSLGDQALIVKLLTGMGVTQMHLGNYVDAQVYFREGVDISRSLQDVWGLGRLLSSLGIVETHRANYSAARAYFEEALPLRKSSGDILGLAASLQNWGLLEVKEGNYLTARTLTEQSLEITEDLGHVYGSAALLNSLGFLEEHDGNLPAAKSYYRRCLLLRDRIGDQRGRAEVLTNLGEIALKQNSYAEARENFEQSLKISYELDFKSQIVENIEKFASLACSVGNFAYAIQYWSCAKRLRQGMGEPLTASEKQRYDQIFAAAYDHLDIKALETAQEVGQRLTVEEVVDQILKQLGLPRDNPVEGSFTML